MKREKRACINCGGETVVPDPIANIPGQPPYHYFCGECGFVGPCIIRDVETAKPREAGQQLELGHAKEKKGEAARCPRCGMLLRKGWDTCLVCGGRLP